MSRRSVAWGVVGVFAVCFVMLRSAKGQGAGATSFAANEDWTHGPYFGTLGTFFADVDGDGRADAIVVNNNTVVVRRSDGSKFQGNEDWTHGPYFGSRGTFFADVNGDKKADAIVVNDNTVTVRLSTVTCFIWCWNWHFDNNQDWTHGPYFGSSGTYFADVDGDGKADAIVINNGVITVRRSNGSGFKPNETWAMGWVQGTYGTYFVDINGDGKADAVAVNVDTAPTLACDVRVQLSTGSGFNGGSCFLLTSAGPAVGSGTHALGFGNIVSFTRPIPVMFAANDNGVIARRAKPINPQQTPVVLNTLGPMENFTGNAYFGTRGTFFADVTGDGEVDAIVVNDNTVVVRRATP